MTLTAKTMEWLNQNRHRSYPLNRDEWRALGFTTADSGLDYVLLDALVFDADAIGDEKLVLQKIKVTEEKTVITMSYGKNQFSLELIDNETNDNCLFDNFNGVVKGNGRIGASISLTFSSHQYILSTVGVGEWNIDCSVLKSRVIRVSNGIGVDGLSTNGSKGIPEHTEAKIATGDVVLEDGYRTSPIIDDDEVLVRVGTDYGYDPCNYDFGEGTSRDCRVPLFFFCGQNAINNGNISLKGGQGISVKQGGTYTVDDEKSTCNGKTIPCIEIVAGRELLDMCKQNSGSENPSVSYTEESEKNCFVKAIEERAKEKAACRESQNETLT